MDIQKEIKINECQPVVFCSDSELMPLYEVLVERWRLKEDGLSFAASVFYNLGRVHGIRAERARRKKK